MAQPHPLSCYRCLRPANPGDEHCSTCGIPLDWGAFSDLRAIDYLLARLEMWRRQGVVDTRSADRMAIEVRRNREVILRGLTGPPPSPAPAPSVPIAAEPGVAVPPPPPPEAPAAGAAAGPPGWAATPPGAAPPQRSDGPPSFYAPGSRRPDSPPPFRQAARPPAPRRSFLDALVDFGTVRLMLYAGALLLAVAVLIWLRDTLREQLQRPVVQAGLLASFTATALFGGVALVLRSKDRVEQRIIGRGFLLLGTFLLPLNPWFWLRSGLIEDRGNAWIATLVTFAVSTAVAFGLGDRIFVVISYAFALATAWLFTYKVTGGAPAGAYALGVVAVSLVFVVGERAVTRAREEDPKWAGLGWTMFWCGHVGLAVTIVAYTWFVRLLPPELMAAFRYFDGPSFSPWIGSAVPAVAALGYFWSAWRRRLPVWSALGASATAWAVVMWLISHDVRPGAWLIASGVLAAVFLGAGWLLAPRDEFGPALVLAGRVSGWFGLGCAVVATFAHTSLDQPVRAATAGGAFLLVLAFGADAWFGRSGAAAFGATSIVVLLAGWALHEAGLSWIVTDTVLAAALTGAPFLLDRIGNDRSSVRSGARTATSCGVMLLGVGLLALLDTSTSLTHWRLVPLGILVAGAALLHGWTTRAPLVRYPAYAVGFAFLQLVALLAVDTVRAHADLAVRYAVFALGPYAGLLACGWFAMRGAVDIRAVALRRTLRAAAWAGVAVAFISAFPLLLDSVMRTEGRLLFAAAMLMLSAIPFAFAARTRDGAVAHVESVYGWLLVVGGWLAVMSAIAGESPGHEGIVVASFFGTAPLLLAGVATLVSTRLPAIGHAALGVACTVAVLTLPANFVMLGDDFASAEDFRNEDRAAFFLLGSLSLLFVLWRAAERRFAAWPYLWSAAAIVPAACIARGAIAAAPDARIALAVVACVAVLVFVARGILLAGERTLAKAALPVAHAVVAVALLSALDIAGQVGRVTWTTVVAFTIATAGFAVAGYFSERSETSRTMHRGLAIVFAYLSYALIGLRYELEPWRDSAYFTLPPGLLLVAIGVVGSRRKDAEGAGALMWFGSLVAAGPMLLHALANRYVSGVSPTAYDVATITLGLALAAVGRMATARGPFLVGAVVFVVDIFVVVIAAIRWQDLPPAIYLGALGALLFGTAWVLLYKREALRRLGERMGGAARSFRDWT